MIKDNSMKICVFLFLVIFFISAMGQEAVYDSISHQQSIINHNALVRSQNQIFENTRAWLSDILEQNKNTTWEVYYTKTDLIKKIDEVNKKLDEKIGDPMKYRIHVEEVAPGQLYENKSLADIRAEGINNKDSNYYNADKLFGEKKSVGASGRVGEAAYVNYENVLMRSANDKQSLYSKREVLATYLDTTKNLVEVAKIKAGIAVVDSKLQSLYENEKNAALKILAIKARNDINKEMKEDLYAEAIPKAAEAMSNQMLENFKNLGKSK